MPPPIPPKQPDEEDLKRCESILGYSFLDQTLLLTSLTHASAARTRLESNERIEFLGDAILGAVVCEELYKRYPEHSEGELTRIKSVVVSRATCARLIREMELGEFLILGKGISPHLPVPDSVLATAFEGFIGGIYLDGGLDAARTFILNSMKDDIIDAAESTVGVNYKSLFQQKSQRDSGQTPVYIVQEERGPDHLKAFKIAARLGETVYAGAWGRSKKVAEQYAACNALAQMEGEDPPYDDEDFDSQEF